jgi:hypothetical protein
MIKFGLSIEVKQERIGSTNPFPVVYVYQGGVHINPLALTDGENKTLKKLLAGVNYRLIRLP